MGERDEARATGAAAGRAAGRRRLPDWLKVEAGRGESFREVQGLLRKSGLNTVCRSALCPNVGRCFERGTATFLILGDRCTRNCRFCAVAPGRPEPPDPQEPGRVAEAVRRLGLRHAVITSVTRDDLADGGAAHFAATVRALRETVPACRVELLIPDFQGQAAALLVVLESAPDVLNHNLETVPRLYPLVRPAADYGRSLELLRRAAAWYAGRGVPGLVKSGVMVGLGETVEELAGVMRDLAAAGCAIMTIGQYLQPSRGHLPVSEFYPPERFDDLRRLGRSLGLRHVEAGPLVRSSFMADRQVEALGD